MWDNAGEATSRETTVVWPLTSYLKNHPSKINKICGTMREKLHPMKLQLYGHLPPTSKTIQVRSIRHVEQCWRSKDKLISDVLQWTTSASVDQPARTYLHQLYVDTGYSLENLLEAMDDRDGWWERVRETHVVSMTWWWRIWLTKYFFFQCSCAPNKHLGRCGLVSLFNGISTFLGYLMLKPSLKENRRFVDFSLFFMEL